MIENVEINILLKHLSLFVFKCLVFVLPDTVTSSLVPINPWSEPYSDVLSYPVIEVEEFIPDIASLNSCHDSYVNNMYVKPMSLKYDGQKTFTKVSCSIYISIIL